MNGKKFVLSIVFMGALVAPVASYSSASGKDYGQYIAPALVTAIAGYFIWSHWDNSRPLFSDSVVPISDTITLVQPSVSEQGNFNDGGASCGYHALKNAIGILQDDRSYLTDEKFIADNFTLDSGENSWRGFIKKEQKDNGEWIETQYFEELIKKEFGKRGLSNFSIINRDLMALKTEDVNSADIFQEIKDCMSVSDTYKHAFFINTGSGEIVGQHAHWYVLVMDKKADGTITYTVMDSLGNANRTQEDTVLNVISKMS